MIRRFFSILEPLLIVLLVFWFFATLAVGFIVVKKPDILSPLMNFLTPKPTITPTTIKGVGVLGDSQSDEYRADDRRGENFPSTTLSWVEILEQKRGIDFGTWDSRDEPRREGYAYNWARSGATARSMIASGQHIGLAQQVKEGAVNLVIIYIGANDYAPYLTDDGYEKIYNGELSNAAIINKQNRYIADVKTALDTINAAGNPKILLIQIPDWGNNFGIQLVFPLPQNRQRVTDVVKNTNLALATLAHEYGIATLDPNVFYRDVNQKQEKGKLTVDSVRLEKLILNDDPKNMFLSDGIHPGTILNGLFANHIVSTLNTHFGTHIPALSEKEIVNIAGL